MASFLRYAPRLSRSVHTYNCMITFPIRQVRLCMRNCGIISLANRDPNRKHRPYLGRVIMACEPRNGRKNHMQSTSPYSGTCRRGRQIFASSAMLLIISVSRYHQRNPRNKNLINRRPGLHTNLANRRQPRRSKTVTRFEQSHPLDSKTSRTAPLCLIVLDA